MLTDHQAKEKERRLKMREEKMEQQRLHQEERVRRALERAKAEPKKAVGAVYQLIVYQSSFCWFVSTDWLLQLATSWVFWQVLKKRYG